MIAISSKQQRMGARLSALLWCLLTLFSCGSLANVPAVQSESAAMTVAHAHHGMAMEMAADADSTMPCCEQLVLDCCEPAITVAVKNSENFELPTLALVTHDIKSAVVISTPPDPPYYANHSQWLMHGYPRLHLVHSILLD